MKSLRDAEDGMDWVFGSFDGLIRRWSLKTK